MIKPGKRDSPEIFEKIASDGDEFDNFALSLVIVFVSGAVLAQPDDSGGELSALDFDAAGVIGGGGEE